MQLTFYEHINNKIRNAAKSARLLRELLPLLSRKKLLIIYKSFVRPHIDYGDNICDQPTKSSFSN